MRRGAGRERGFSLMEVLIALLVLGIGLLGLAALQAQGLRFSTESYSRSQATVLAYDIIDRIRANRANAAAYAAANITGAGADAVDPTTCNDADAAKPVSVTNDLACWLRVMQGDATVDPPLPGLLPGAVPTIAQNGANANYLDITLTWVDREPREFSADAAPRFARLPTTSDECLFVDGNNANAAVAGRSWNGTAGICMVSQTWTVYP
ncbi:MAG: type IV pilus modification protein PilV [Ectothiorhodospiraceae bacterium]|nr:type IV pilus modification protein PilV [Chromatiales bacterium]MCP5155334.1 type IV pilus modification protein PilV [Ectothiorhodospiraceae bacterium]